MTIPIFCQVAAEADRLTFRWSDGSGAFEPYALTGQCFVNFWTYAQQARDALRDLAQSYADGATTDEELGRGSFRLAQAGHALYRQIFRPDADHARVAAEVRQWLTLLRTQGAIESLEVVLEGARGVPWNVIYEDKPDEKAFLAGGGDGARWLPFWGVRYNLAGGRRVNPLRRLPLLKDPHVLLVVDPFVRDRLPDDQRRRLADFAARPGLTLAESREQLEEALRERRPDLMYWFCHARPEELVLGDQSISPGQLLELLQGDDLDGDRPVGGLAFFNACRTAEAGQEGSFLDAVYNFGMSGLVATEQQTVDTFANPFGLDFLEEFLRGEAPIGELLHRLRCRGLPLGLLYALYCPPHIKVGRPKGSSPEVREKRPVPGGTLLGQPEPAQLPETPYRPLVPYDRAHRALFAGRGREVEAFAELLDADATRLVVLHGASGVGKSSFLRAGVIPYLEEECYGYGFLREQPNGDGRPRVLLLRCTGDPVSQLASALLAFCAHRVSYPRPAGAPADGGTPAEEAIQSHPPNGTPAAAVAGGPVTLDLRRVLAEQLGRVPDFAGLRAALCADPSLLGRLLAAIASHFPYVPVLVLDQAEEMFTLAGTPGEEESQRAALEMLRRLVQGPGGFRVVVSMRTEYCARLMDTIARGPRGRQGVREFLLAPLDEAGLVEVVLAPTHDGPAAAAAGKYQLRFGAGVPESLVRRVQALAGRRQDSVLVLLQVACLELHRSARSRGEAVIGEKDLERFFGDPDVLREYAEGLVAHALPRPSDRAAFEKLVARLHVRQPGGSLTTALVPAADLAREWTGKAPFEDVVRAARRVGLLRECTLPTADGGGRRCLSLGHDSLARVAAEWDRPPCCDAGPWKKATLALALVLVALLVGLGTLVAYWGFFDEAADEAVPEDAAGVPVGERSPQHGPGPRPEGDGPHLPSTYLARASLHDPKGGETPVRLPQPTAPAAGTRTWAVKDPEAVQRLGQELGVRTRPGQEFRLVVSAEVERLLLGPRNAAATKAQQWLCDNLVPASPAKDEMSPERVRPAASDRLTRPAGLVEKIRIKIRLQPPGRKRTPPG
jgi:hypothetical protein